MSCLQKNKIDENQLSQLKSLHEKTLWYRRDFFEQNGNNNIDNFVQKRFDNFFGKLKEINELYELDKEFLYFILDSSTINHISDKYLDEFIMKLFDIIPINKEEYYINKAKSKQNKFLVDILCGNERNYAPYENKKEKKEESIQKNKIVQYSKKSIKKLKEFKNNTYKTISMKFNGGGVGIEFFEPNEEYKEYCVDLEKDSFILEIQYEQFTKDEIYIDNFGVWRLLK